MALIKRNNAAATATKPATSGNGARDPFAEKFNKAVKENPTGNYESLPVGVWEALCSKGGTHEKDGKLSGWLEFTVVQEGASCFGKSGRAFYPLQDEEGEVGIGAAILARNLGDMSLLDVEEGITSLKQLEGILDGIAADPVWVTIRVQIKKGYTNIRLEKVMADQSGKPELDGIPM